MTKRTSIDRAITPEEVSVIRATLENAAVSPRHTALGADLEDFRAVDRCLCGCDSVDFAAYDPERPPKRIADGTGQTARGGMVGVIVWGTDEAVIGIEVYDLGAGEHDLRLPVPDSIRAW